jgi:hypothetical protein
VSKGEAGSNLLLCSPLVDAVPDGDHELFEEVKHL